MTLRVVLEPSEEGGLTVTVLALPGCISEGDTREEALANIRAAIDETELGANAELVEIAV
jgi:predicted RNase H-like HicB family nuclease